MPPLSVRDVVEEVVVSDDIPFDVMDSFPPELVCPLSECEEQVIFVESSADAWISSSSNNQRPSQDTLPDRAGGKQFGLEREVRAQESEGGCSHQQLHVGGGDQQFVAVQGEQHISAVYGFHLDSPDRMLELGVSEDFGQIPAKMVTRTGPRLRAGQRHETYDKVDKPP